jgi:predicted nucleic acid-binding protein
MKIEDLLKQRYLKHTETKEASEEELQDYTVGDLAKRLFLDTSYVIALSSGRDKHNLLAISLAKEIEEKEIRLLTTRAILLEIGNALSKSQYRQAAIALLDSIERDDNIEIIPISESLYKKGLDLFRKRKDKEWGIIDCISFVVMKERGLDGALTTDHHFTQAGFKALLR